MRRMRSGLVVTLACLATIRGVAAQELTVQYGGLTLRSGQIIVADSYNARSVLMTLSLRDFTSFTHSGVLAVEDGRPVVYETYGDVRFWHKGPPTDAMAGAVERSTLAQYVAGFGHVEIYDPRSGSIAARWSGLPGGATVTRCPTILTFRPGAAVITAPSSSPTPCRREAGPRGN